MIIGVYTVCPGCETPTLLRIGVAVSPGEQQPFAARCPECKSEIRGKLGTTAEADAAVHLDEAQIVPDSYSKDWQVVTIHPAFPSTPGAWTSPFLESVGILGDAYEAYFRAVGRFNGIAAGDWPKLERAFQFYFAEDWDRFDVTMARLLEENWPAKSSTIMRHDVIHRLLIMMLCLLDPASPYPPLKREIWRRAQPSPELLSHLSEPAVKEELLALQRRIFEQISHLISIRHTWLPALQVLWAHRLGRPAPKDWRLPGEDFIVLRDAYRQHFELSCQSLSMLIVAQNVADGRLPTEILSDGDAEPWIPEALPGRFRNSPPRNLAQFRRLTAEAKEAYLDRLPDVQSVWHQVFDRGVRNAIAHADADIEAATGVITTGKGGGHTYVDFVESVIKQMQLLILWLDLAKLLRIYGSSVETPNA
ncbi:hypothetical protein [Micromonospora chalcea]